MHVKSYSFKINSMLFVHANGLFLTAVEKLFCWELKPLATAAAGIVAMGHAGIARKAAMCDLIYLKQIKIFIEWNCHPASIKKLKYL